MILNRYERMIAKRYLLPGKGESFIFLVASISMIGVMLGVAALITVMSVMNGFRADLFDKTAGLNGHAVVQGYGGSLPDWRAIVREAQATPGVTEATPLIEQPLMGSLNGRVAGILVRGLQMKDITGNPLIRDNIVAGSLANIRPGSGEVAIGARLAETLGASVGAPITVISPQGQTTPFGTLPRSVGYTVGAIFEVGVYDYDNAFVIMPMADAQTLLMLGDSVGMVEIVTNDADRVQDILKPLVPKIAGQAEIRDWRQNNAALFEALSVERVVMFWILSLIILVAAFNILSSLIMLVRAKTRDIAILRTMGASRGAMIRIFMTVGVTVGALGTLAGVALGFILLYFRQGIVDGVQYLSGQNLWDPSIRFLTEMPARTDPVEVFAIVAMAIGSTFLFTLYPAWKAASTDPVQVLRYE
ncbi:lipoprotein-releasing ABC transporter permease subunit [Sphingomonas montana]|uniref:lipoprotein-releasing ABC transporter permease subunit n=1 Tax=Sphingomonas montana TaxID=1843236 RepID=UPI00096F58D9|nr:lipoprotein-releasing ABC transporter permease subunit [Sphingomonas montana]